MEMKVVDETHTQASTKNSAQQIPETPVAQQWRSNQLRRRSPAWTALIIIALVAGLQPFDPALHSLALPAAAENLGMDASSASFIRSLSTVVLSACLLGVGLIGDRMGRRKAMVTGIFLMAFAAGIAVVATVPWMLGLSRVLMGIGTAFSFSMCLAFVPTLFSKRDLPRAFAVLLAVQAGLAMLGAATAGFIQDLFGWRASYGTTMAVCIALGLAAWYLLPENKASTQRRFDTVGVLLSAVGLVLLVFSLGQAATLGWTNGGVLLGLGLSLVVLFMFVMWERRVEDPGFPIALFKVPAFAAACLVGVLFNWADASLLGQVPALAIPAGVSSGLVSLVVAGLYLGMICGSIAAGLTQRRFGISNRFMFCSGMLMCAVSLGIQVWVTDPHNLLLPALGLYLVGFAIMWMQNPQAAVILGSAPKDQVGAVGAIKPAVGQFGFGFGFALAAPISAIYGDGTGTLTVHSYGMGLFTQAWVFVLAAVVLYFMLSPKRVARSDRSSTESPNS